MPASRTTGTERNSQNARGECLDALRGTLAARDPSTTFPFALQTATSLRMTVRRMYSGPNAPAHKMDDFELVAIGKLRSVPAVAGKEVAVEFDSDPVGLHTKLNEQSGNSGY